MLIKIIRLHVSLELPDGDCIGGRLQLVFSFFLFSPPALKKKSVVGGGRVLGEKGSFGMYGMAAWGVPVTIHSESACLICLII